MVDEDDIERDGVMICDTKFTLGPFIQRKFHSTS